MNIRKAFIFGIGGLTLLLGACEGDRGREVVKYVKGVDKLNEKLHFARISVEAEIEKKVIEKSLIKKEFPIAKVPEIGFSGMIFLVPGRSDLAEKKTSSSIETNSPLDMNLVHVMNISPWKIEDYAKRPSGARDMRVAWELMYQGRSSSSGSVEEKYGMKCFRESLNRGETSRYICAVGCCRFR